MLESQIEVRIVRIYPKERIEKRKERKRNVTNELTFNSLGSTSEISESVTE
jgi:hypothetical protein